MIAVATSAAHVPGPPELLPGRPDASIDLQTSEADLVGARWRYADAHVEEIDFVELGTPEDPLGPGTIPNRTYDVVPHAEAADFDDSGWRTLAPEETMLRLANGRVCFNWYRIDVTIPERVGGFETTGSTIVFEVVVDDYAEVWVNGELPVALGDRGGHVAAGFNAPNRIVLTRDARPGGRFTIAVFGINGPISASPRNYIWLRTATLDFYAAERAQPWREAPLEVEGDVPVDGPLQLLATGFDAIEALLPMPDGSVLFSSPRTIYRWHDGVVSVFRTRSDAAGLAFSPGGLLTIAQCEHGRVLRVNPHGDTTVVLSDLDEPRAVVYAPDGSLITADARGVQLDGVPIAGARGVALALSGSRLVVVDGEGILTIDPPGGVDVLCDFEDEPRGIAADAHGRLYVAGAKGISLLTWEGDRLGALRLPEAPRALALSGSDLYISAETSLYRLRLTEGAA